MAFRGRHGFSIAVFLMAAILLLLFSCGGGNAAALSAAKAPPTYPAQFTATPADTGDFAFIIALGSMSPPGHTMPVDHVYFYVVDPDVNPGDLYRTRRLYAPGAGRVVEIRRGTDDSLTIQMNSTVSYYMSHLLLDNSIALGSELTAGQYLGTFSARVYAFDIGVIDMGTTVPLINPNRFPYTTPHAGKPLTLFTEPVRSAIYGRVRREGPDRNGRIDYDVPGTASGYWFLQGLTVADSPYSLSGPSQLALARDAQCPANQAISIGGTLSYPGAYITGLGEADWTTVTPASGAVTYTLRWPPDGPTSQIGAFMRLQLLNENTLKIETFPQTYPDLMTVAPPFTANAKIYVR